MIARKTRWPTLNEDILSDTIFLLIWLSGKSKLISSFFALLAPHFPSCVRGVLSDCWRTDPLPRRGKVKEGVAGRGVAKAVGVVRATLSQVRWGVTPPLEAQTASENNLFLRFLKIHFAICNHRGVRAAALSVSREIFADAVMCRQINVKCFALVQNKKLKEK